MKKYYTKKQEYSKSFSDGNLVFVSAMDGRSADTGKVTSDNLEEQMTTALDKLRSALEEAGSSADNLIKTTVFLTDTADFPLLKKAEQKYFKKYAPSLAKEPPASTLINVRSLADPQCRVAVEAVAVVDRKKTGWELQKYYNGSASSAQSAAAGNLLFVSAIEDKAPDSFEKQMISCLDGIREAVEEAGGSMNDVVKVGRIIKNLGDIPAMWRTEIDYCKKHAPLLAAEPPASFFLQPQSLENTDSLIGMEAIAVIPANKTGWEIKPEWEVTRRPLYYGVRQPFAKSIVVGNLVLLSAMHGGRAADGRPAMGDLEAQMLAVMDKVRLSMLEARSSMNNIGKVTIFVKNPADYPRIREMMLKYYKEHAPLLLEEPPAATIVQPYSLANPYHLVAIEATGVVTK